MSTECSKTRRFANLGRIRKSIGTSGQVLADFATNLDAAISATELIGLHIWITPPPLEWRDGCIVEADERADGYVLRFEGLEDVDIAKQLAGANIVIDAKDMRTEWQAADAADGCGLAVHDTRYGDVGVVREVLATGANDVWVLDGPYGEVLIPVIDEVIIAQDTIARTATTTIPNGLIDTNPLVGGSPDTEPPCV